MTDDFPAEYLIYTHAYTYTKFYGGVRWGSGKMLDLAEVSGDYRTSLNRRNPSKVLSLDTSLE